MTERDGERCENLSHTPQNPKKKKKKFKSNKQKNSFFSFMEQKGTHAHGLKSVITRAE